MDKIYRLGVIGCGGIGTNVHLKQLAEVNGAIVTALCDIDPQHLQNAAEKYHIDATQCYTDYKDLIDHADIDAVEICTPNNSHCMIAQYALQKGKAVNIEKPVGINVAETEELLKTAQQVKQPVMVCFSYRFRPAVRYAKTLLEENKLGKIVSVYAQYLKDSAYMPGRRLDWRFDADIARYGVSGDLAVHVIDMLRLLVGEFRSVCAQTGIAVKERMKLNCDEFAPVTTDDFCHFLAELDHNIPAVFTVSRCAHGNKNHIMIDLYGEKGAIRFDLNHPEQLEVLNVETGLLETVSVPEKYFIQQEQTFVDLLHDNAPPFTPNLNDGVAAQKVLDALLLSAETHQWQSIE